jgi:hypothetical protein
MNHFISQYCKPPGHHNEANQNYENPSMSNSAQLQENLDTLRSFFSSIEGTAQGIRCSQDSAQDRVRKSKLFANQCQDAWNSDDLASMLKKREQILKQL